jgi:hypothetical protein
VTRDAFEDMVRPMLRQTVELVHQTMERARVSAQELSNVLLVGGSSRIPMVSRLIEQDLGVPVRVDTHPKLVVPRGAARRAGIEIDRRVAMPAPSLTAPAPAAPAMAPPPPPAAMAAAPAAAVAPGRSVREPRGAVVAPKPAADAIGFAPDHDDDDGTAAWRRPVLLAAAVVIIAAIVAVLVLML